MTLLETLATMSGTDEKMRALIPSQDDGNSAWGEHVIGCDWDGINAEPLCAALEIAGKVACQRENEIVGSGVALGEYIEILSAFSSRLSAFADLLRSFETIEQIQKLERDYIAAETSDEKTTIHKSIARLVDRVEGQSSSDYSFALSAYSALKERIAK
jgi:hypothetical protein